MYKQTRTSLEAKIQGHNGVLLDTEIKTTASYIRLRCAKGHEWKTRAASILYAGSWCGKCAQDEKKLDHEEIKRIALDRGGRCVTDVYKSVRTKMEWECAQGHRFSLTTTSLKNGMWCPNCSPGSKTRGEQKGLKEVLRLAAALGGHHTGVATNVNVVTDWACHEGHQFRTSGKAILNRGYFCKECALGTFTTIEKVQELCAYRGGKCLSGEYKGLADTMRFECARGHQWDSTWRHLRYKGSWCPQCGKVRSGVDALVNIATKKGGIALSSVYKTLKSVYEWQCSRGHTFNATMTEARGRWCTDCSQETKSIPSILEERRKVAEGFGGQVVETEDSSYRCADGHQFSASLPVAKAVWCPECATGSSIFS